MPTEAGPNIGHPGKEEQTMVRPLICWHSLIVAFLIIAVIIVVSALLITAHTAFMTSHQALVGPGRAIFHSVWHV